MSLLSPLALVVGTAALAVLGGLHLLSRRRPRATVLPTARFVPDRPTRLLSRATALSDPWLLALRALAVIAIALAFARPVLAGRRARLARVVVLDRSRAVADAGELRDSARALGVAVATIVFDSTATRLTSAAAVDSLATSGARGSLSVGLVAAIRAGAEAARGGDSVAIVLVSPLAAEETDAATAAIRAAWPGAIRVVRVSGAAALPARGTVDVRAPAGDPVAAAVALAAPHPAAAARVVRDAPTAGDSAWAGAGAGHVLVLWPMAEAGGAPRDTIGAVIAGDAVVVAQFARLRAPPPARGATVVARWNDGAPAAVERALGAGCVRDVAIPVDPRSDIALRPGFARLVAALTAPCGGAVGGPVRPAAGRVGPSAAQGVGPSGDELLGRRADALAGRNADAARSAPLRTTLVPALLALGMALLGVEGVVRRRAGGRRS